MFLWSEKYRYSWLLHLQKIIMLAEIVVDPDPYSGASWIRIEIQCIWIHNTAGRHGNV